jgi:hypothetical protein
MKAHSPSQSSSSPHLDITLCNSLLFSPQYDIVTTLMKLTIF